jgi:rubrerythrin
MTDKSHTLGIQLTEDQYMVLDEHARAQGYDDVSAYLLALAEQDLADNDVDEEFTQDRILADFKQAWHEAMTGQTRSIEELWTAVEAMEDEE